MTVNGDIYLKVASDCHTGASVTVSPPTAASVVKQAHTDDGSMAAIVLHPQLKRFDVQVRRPGRAVNLVHVDLDSLS